MTFHYATCCVESDGKSIDEMRDAAREITYRTALKHMAGLREWAKAHGYEARAPGCTLKHDWSVSYHRSVYQGQQCYYLVWSHIEYIWLEGSPPESWGYGELNEEGERGRHRAGRQQPQVQVGVWPRR